MLNPCQAACIVLRHVDRAGTDFDAAGDTHLRSICQKDRHSVFSKSLHRPLKKTRPLHAMLACRVASIQCNSVPTAAARSALGKSTAYLPRVVHGVAVRSPSAGAINYISSPVEQKTLILQEVSSCEHFALELLTVHECAYLDMYTYIRMHIHMYIYVYTVYVIPTYKYKYIYIYICIYMICVHIHTYDLHLQMSIHIYIYIHIIYT